MFDAEFRAGNEFLGWEWGFPGAPNIGVLLALLLVAPWKFVIFQAFMIWIFWDKLEWHYGLESSSSEAGSDHPGRSRGDNILHP